MPFLFPDHRGPLELGYEGSVIRLHERAADVYDEHLRVGFFSESDGYRGFL